VLNFESAREFLSSRLQKISADTIGWLAVLFLHGATIPATVGLLLGISDRLPSIDVVLFVWSGLVLLFIRSLVLRDTINIITIGGGFIIHAALLGLLVFK
jgi:hypothetical protein